MGLKWRTSGGIVLEKARSERDQYIWKLFEEEISMRQIARMVGCSRTHVGRIINGNIGEERKERGA